MEVTNRTRQKAHRNLLTCLIRKKKGHGKYIYPYLDFHLQLTPYLTYMKLQTVQSDGPYFMILIARYIIKIVHIDSSKTSYLRTNPAWPLPTSQISLYIHPPLHRRLLTKLPTCSSSHQLPPKLFWFIFFDSKLRNCLRNGRIRISGVWQQCCHW